MNIYHYHPSTGAYLGPSQADPNPVEPGQWLIPAHATKTAPPKAGAGSVAVFAGGVWSLETDQRGTIYWLPDGREVEITRIGDTKPAGGLDAPPTQDDPLKQPLSSLQFGAALRSIGLTRQRLETHIKAAIIDPNDQAIAIERIYSSQAYHRDNPLFDLLAPLVGVTDKEIDELWAWALKIS